MDMMISGEAGGRSLIIIGYYSNYYVINNLLCLLLGYVVPFDASANWVSLKTYNFNKTF